MNMKQLLNKLSAERLKRYINAPVWHNAAQRELSWEEAAVESTAIQEAYAMLSPCAVEVLREMLRLFGIAPIEEERLLKELRRSTTLSGAECQLGLAELEEAGILFTIQKTWGESLFFMPVECFAGWQRVLFPFQADSLSAVERERLMNGMMRPYCRPLSRQLLCAFSVLGRSGLSLTTNGTLAKKTVMKLAEVLDIKDTWLQTFHLKWSYSDSYPVQIAFILEAGTALGLLTAAEGTLKWNESKLCEWLMLDDHVRELELFTWCSTLLLPSSATSAHLAVALTGQQTGDWYSNEHLENWYKNLFVSIKTGEEQRLPLSIHNPNWYGLWHNIGYLELVDGQQSEEKKIFYRWKSVAPLQKQKIEHMRESYSFAAVLPNGELIIQSDCPYWIRWELELIADRKSDEQVTVYRLEAATIARAIEQGRTRSSIQTFLTQISGGEPLPPTIVSLLELWTSRACRTSFAEVTLLRCDNEEMATVVESNANIAPLLIQKLGSLDFIIEKSQVSPIRAILQKAGYPARKTVQLGIVDDEYSYPLINAQRERTHIIKQLTTDELQRPVSIYIYEAFPLNHYELNELGARKKLESMSQLERVPAMWIKQLRAYHHSTRRELIEKALQMQTPVQLRIATELRSFVPEKLELQDDGWVVVGLMRDDSKRELIRLTPDMWEEMRLVIPGHDAPI